VEHAAVIGVEAFAWRCPQQIPQQFTLDGVGTASGPLRARIATLEAAVRARRRAESGLER